MQNCFFDFSHATHFELLRVSEAASQEIAARGGREVVQKYWEPLPSASAAPKGCYEFLDFRSCDATIVVSILEALMDGIAMRGGLGEVMREVREFEDEHAAAWSQLEFRRFRESSDDEIPI